ncbi:MAG: hypothetical protein CMM48_16875 [Rhodospirillaceae bacterium]|nr:hypothetical protein [Rhodospirillaceae bacterium]HAA91337.1 hypothetical protein [Rhodospirillaceae bacterium]|tara:strand:- start:202 stop:585 length:384 start_codon:yes stop_codon:yes gene_type:complete
MNPLRLAPWLALFAALLLMMQTIWLLHLTFFVGGGFLLPAIYSGAISLPLFFFARGGWRLLKGSVSGKQDSMIGAGLALIVGFLLMVFGSVASIATVYTMFFCFFSAIAGFVSVMLVNRASKEIDKK